MVACRAASDELAKSTEKPLSDRALPTILTTATEPKTSRISSSSASHASLSLWLPLAGRPSLSSMSRHREKNSLSLNRPKALGHIQWDE